MKNAVRHPLLAAVIFGVSAAGSTPTSAQGNGDDLLGLWITEPGDGLIRIERQGEQYHGTITGAPPGTRMDPDARDVNNPDPALRERLLIGLQIMGAYRYDGKRWAGGWIYDPDVGKRYKSRLTLRDDGDLEVRGYLGAPMFGRTQIWTRAADSADQPDADP